MNHHGQADDSKRIGDRPRHAAVRPGQSESERERDEGRCTICLPSLRSADRVFKQDRQRTKRENLEANKHSNNGKRQFHAFRCKHDVQGEQDGEADEIETQATSHRPSKKSPYVKSSIRYGDRLHNASSVRLTMKVLFVCVGNSCRSQMAEGLATSMGLEAASAGTHPADRVAEHAITLLEAKGISTEGMTPKNLDGFDPTTFDKVISMGCGVHCPAINIDEDWGLEDPVGHDFEVYERTAEEIQRRLRLLVAQSS